MRASTALSTLSTLVLAACAGDSGIPTSPPTLSRSNEVAQDAREHGQSRPFSGSCVAQTAGPATFVFPIRTQLSIGTCQLSHLGRTSLRTLQHVNVVTGDEVAELTYKAANGDKLFATNVGTSAPTGPTTIAFSGTNTVTGGTGRFDDATGTFSASGTADLATGAAAFAYDGWIAYEASNRHDR